MRWERTWHREGGYRKEGGRRKGGRGEERVCMIALCVDMDMSGYINILQIPKAHVYTVYMYMQSTTKCTLCKCTQHMYTGVHYSTTGQSSPIL